jgi:predicted dehydrogenase
MYNGPLPTAEVNRRRFIKTAALAAAAGPLVLSTAKGKATSERVRLAFIGCGGRMGKTLPMFLSSPDAQLVAICDVVEPRMDERMKEIAGTRKDAPPPDREVDYRRVLDRKDVDAVVISTPQHQHAIPFIHACQAGKHVFVEKPLSQTVVEGRAIVEAAKKAGVVAMMGTQQRAGPHFQKAVEMVRSGRLGRVPLVECWNYHDTRNRVGRAPDSDPPAGTHWDQWLGPAPRVAYNPCRLRTNWWFDYSGGMLADWGVHHFDVVHWAMNAAGPTSATCTGGKFVIDDLADTPDTIEAAWEFPNVGGVKSDRHARDGWVLRYSYRGYNNYPVARSRPHGHGICFHGTRATLLLDRHGYELVDEKNPKEAIETARAEPYFLESQPRKSDQDGVWHRLFVECVKQNKRPPLDLEDSHRATVLCHLGNIAYLTGRRVKWDGEKESFEGDAEAAAMLDRPRRKGYELPKV